MEWRFDSLLVKERMMGGPRGDRAEKKSSLTFAGRFIALSVVGRKVRRYTQDQNQPETV